MSGNSNPGNFANRDKEEVSEIGRKGGQSSHSGGFASMDPQKQVCHHMKGANGSMRLPPRAVKRPRNLETLITLQVKRRVRLGRKADKQEEAITSSLKYTDALN
jgi:general stress protein YciG